MSNKLSFLARLILCALRFYQRHVSGVIGGRNACRFTPSCSEYMAQSITKYGAFHGACMGFRRILRCRPGGGCGYDPVP